MDMNEEIFKSILGKFNECQEACECKEKQDNKKNTDKILHERHRALNRDLDRCHGSLVAMFHSYLTLVKEVKEMESILRERSGESNNDD